MKQPEPMMRSDPWRVLPATYARVVSGGRWKPYRWLDWLGYQLWEHLLRGNARVIVNAHPRAGKSEFISKYLPLWYLGMWPERRVVITSYGGELSLDFGRAIRNEAKMNPLCGVNLRDDSSAANRWHTVEGGGLVAVGVGGALSGRGFDLGICEDPIKDWEQAYSLRYRRRLVDWFNSVFYTRREPNASIIVVKTRWHDDDLTAYLTEKHEDDWTLIRLPALAEPGDPMGRAEGEPLCPERFDRDSLIATMAGVGEVAAAALYQQNPESFGTGRVYRKFTLENIDADITFVPGLHLDLSIDFNLNPGMHMIVGQYDPAADLFTAIYEIHGPRMTIEPAMDRFRKIVDVLPAGQDREVWVYGDATSRTMRDVTATAAGYEIVQRKLREFGLKHRLRVPSHNPNVRESIESFNDAFADSAGVRHYKVHPRCERLIRDFKELKADESGMIDKADLSMSHSADAERYRVHYVRPVVKLDLSAMRNARVGGVSVPA